MFQPVPPSNSSGFTLVELLMIITIMGIMGSLIIATNPMKYFSEAKNTVVQKDFNFIKTQIEAARIRQVKTFGQITNMWCTDCACRTPADVTTDTGCINQILNSWRNVSIDPLPTDPWGNYYMWDENEYEGGSGNCTRDSLRSVGPDHRYGGSDDIGTEIKPYFCPP